MNKKRRFFESEAKRLLLDLRRDKGLTYSELARRLEAQGILIDTQVLTNKLNRGNYKFSFALQVLAAMNEKTIRVPQLPHELQTSKRPEPSDEPT